MPMLPATVAVAQHVAHLRLVLLEQDHVVIGLAIDLHLLATEDVGLATKENSVEVMRKHFCEELKN